ncbi:MAG: aminodeoxychorismate synthase component I [Emcibacter sp.]|nr:aminodeoxychorismate synthase component I [Emcibacter sp.]
MTRKKCADFSVFLDNNRPPAKGRRIDQATAYLFQNPLDLITANSPGDMGAAFEKIQDYLDAGYYIAGWISYEAGLIFEPKLAPLYRSPQDAPLLSFGVYKEQIKLTPQASEAHWAEISTREGYELSNVRLNIARPEYETAAAKIHQYLKAGDIYQVNYTLKSLFDFTGNAESYYAAMRKAQQVEYGAFIKSDDQTVLSLSPELFFQKKGHKIYVRPMKGTCPRGRNLEEDHHNAHFMQNDEKNRAENLMIVDLLRNDLARIATPGTVKLKSLYDVEKYRTLFQMTSTIEAEVPEDVGAIDLIRALFPCGSVTGAPKIRAMEIISELEKGPRGIYTGAIGYMAPDGDCCFNVPIRTVIIDAEGRGEMGIGSAIVADSRAAEEYDECLLKAKFATGDFRDFDLIETMRWSAHDDRQKDAGGLDFLDLHMSRLISSARYFDFPCDVPAILDDLKNHILWLDPETLWKVRLLLSKTGKISITSTPLDSLSEHKPAMITLSDIMADSRDPMRFHKTTDRLVFDQELQNHQKKYGSYDVIFENETGILTEGTFNNLFLKKDDILYTPPLDCGVLKGVLRQSLIEDPAVKIVEKRLTLADLRRADHIYMGNSVRGLMAVTFNDLH